jgi:HJR/Mrr/RecB family endonuclease
MGDDEAGIDLVAETRDGHLWAIQAKAYDSA